MLVDCWSWLERKTRVSPLFGIVSVSQLPLSLQLALKKDPPVQVNVAAQLVCASDRTAQKVKSHAQADAVKEFRTRWRRTNLSFIGALALAGLLPRSWYRLCAPNGLFWFGIKQFFISCGSFFFVGFDVLESVGGSFRCSCSTPSTFPVGARSKFEEIMGLGGTWPNRIDFGS